MHDVDYIRICLILFDRMDIELGFNIRMKVIEVGHDLEKKKILIIK